MFLASSAFHFKSVVYPSVLCVQTTEDFDDVRVRRVALQHRLEETDFELVIFRSGHDLITHDVGSYPRDGVCRNVHSLVGAAKRA